MQYENLINQNPSQAGGFPDRVGAGTFGYSLSLRYYNRSLTNDVGHLANKLKIYEFILMRISRMAYHPSSLVDVTRTTTSICHDEIPFVLGSRIIIAMLSTLLRVFLEIL